MKKLTSYITILLCMLTFAACQDKDFDIQPAKVQPFAPSQLTCEQVGDDYVISWPAELNLGGAHVTIYRGENSVGSNQVIGDTKFAHKDVPTNVPYTYVVKAIDKDGNLSSGIILDYTRLGSESVTDLTLAQIDKAGGYDMSATWELPEGQNLTSVKFIATSGDRKIEKVLAADATSFKVENVVEGEEWNVAVVAINAVGPALSTRNSLKIGTTKIGYLSIYDTIEELVANGDDDEVAGWAWLSKEYVNAEFVPFSTIMSEADIESYRVLFWMRDLEEGGADAVFKWPEVVVNATPAIKEWYRKGGSMLLWSHATPYVEQLGRIPVGTWRKPGSDFEINTEVGGVNNDEWPLSVKINTEGKFQKDNSNHPLFKGMRNVNPDAKIDGKWQVVLIPFKSGGFTENHNCLFFNLPGRITGEPNQEGACYEKVVNNFGIIPLGTWDGQSKWIGQLNVWEAAKCKTHTMSNNEWFSPAVEIHATEGTVICVGNGGCNFNMKNIDGSFERDLNKLPSTNNAFQDNINRLAKNALEYLKTK